MVWKIAKRTVSGCRRRRAVLLRILGLGLVDDLLLLIPLVLLVLGLLVGRNRPLVRESVEHAEGEGGPPENLKVRPISYRTPGATPNIPIIVPRDGSEDLEREGGLGGRQWSQGTECTHVHSC